MLEVGAGEAESVGVTDSVGSGVAVAAGVPVATEVPVLGVAVGAGNELWEGAGEEGTWCGGTGNEAGPWGGTEYEAWEDAGCWVWERLPSCP